MADLAVQKRLLRAMLSLPTPVLRAASGGRAVYVGGRTPHPRLQFLLQMANAREPLQSLPIEDARRAFAERWALVAARPEPGVSREPIRVEGPAGPLPGRPYKTPH